MDIDQTQGEGAALGATADGKAARLLRRLVETGIELSSELSLESVLRRLIETAVELTEAQLRRAGRDRPRRNRPRAVHHRRHRRRRCSATIGDLPRGRGILGVLIRDREALRLSDLSRGSALGRFPARPSADGLVPRRPDHAARRRVRKPLSHREGRRRASSPTRTRSSSGCSPRRPLSRSRTRASTSRRVSWSLQLESLNEVSEALAASRSSPSCSSSPPRDCASCSTRAVVLIELPTPTASG